jgi:hypothetical protein
MISHLSPRAYGNAAALCIAFSLSPLLAQEAALYRVKCGGDGFLDKQGHIWEADAHYEGGQIFSADSAIANTDIPYLYQSERWNDASLGNLKYTFPVRSGDYKVILHFAEIYDGAFAIGQRVFDVSINGTVVAPDLDVFAQVGARAPLDLDYLAQAQEGKITVEFANKAGNAKIAGIEVLPLNPPRATSAPYRIHCGGEDYLDPKGNWWEGDGHFANGSVYASNAPVSGTDMPFLYQTERWNNADVGDLSYSFDVEPGEYAVMLHFAEIFFTSPGQRTFDVDINGTTVLQGLDVAGEVGPNAALVKEFTASAPDGKITLAFHNGAQNAKISAIEVLPAASVRTRGTARPAGREPFFLSSGPGSPGLRSADGKPFVARLVDLRGREAASLAATGNTRVTGLARGIYLADLRQGTFGGRYRVVVP